MIQKNLQIYQKIQYQQNIQMSEKIPWQQVEKHTQLGDCWIVVQGKVFDVSTYMKKHPGGRWIILQNAGKDATQPFLKQVHTEVALQLMNDLYLGQIESPQKEPFIDKKIGPEFNNLIQPDKIIFLVKRLSNQTNTFSQTMKSKKSSQRILTIAQGILKDSMSMQGIKKFNEIKKSLEIRSSKTRNNSHRQSKSKQYKPQNSRKTQPSPKALSNNRMRSKSKHNETNVKSHNKLSSNDQDFVNTKRRSVRFSLQRQYLDQDLTYTKTAFKEEKKPQKTILKPSSLLKSNQTPSRKSQMEKLTEKSERKVYTGQKKQKQNWSPQHIVAKKLFGEQKMVRPIVENEISFNLNLNKILQIVERIVESQKIQRQKLNGSKKESLLSQENARLIRKIGRFFGSKQQSSLVPSFRKDKESTGQKDLEKLNRKLGGNQNEHLQESKNDHNQFKGINLTNSKTSYLEELVSQATSEQFQNNQRSNGGGQYSNKAGRRDDGRAQLQQKILSLRSEKDWLVETIQSLLNQNQQLKRLVVNDK